MFVKMVKFKVFFKVWKNLRLIKDKHVILRTVIDAAPLIRHRDFEKMCSGKMKSEEMNEDDELKWLFMFMDRPVDLLLYTFDLCFA